MRGGLFHSTALAGLALGLVASAPMALAAEAPRNANDPSRALPRPGDDARPLDIERPIETAPPPPGGASFVLNRVIFEGAETLSDAELQKAAAPFLNRPADLSTLKAIARAAEDLYAARGYPFTAIVPPPQEVKGGEVRLKVVEGRISDLTILGKNSIARRQTAAAFGWLVNRKPLSVSDVQSAYERAKDIAGLTLAGALRRGSEAGGMDLVVQARRKTWNVYSNVNNLYSDVTGPWGILLGADYAGASLYGDRTTAQIYTTFDDGEQRVLRLSHNRRLDGSGLAVEASLLVAKANPGGAVSALDLATDVTSASVTVSRPVWSKPYLSLTAQAGLEWTDQKTDVYSKVALTEDHVRTLSLGLTNRWRVGPFTGQGYHQLRKGLDVGGASRTSDPNISRPGANPEALVLRSEGSAETQTWRGVSVAFAWQTQWANDPLLAPEQFQAGNLSIGRGYDPGAAYGDRAFAISAELRAGGYRLPWSLTAQPFLFYDAARVETLGPSGLGPHWLASTGLGVRLETAGRYRIDLTYAAPLHPALGIGDNEPTPRLLVNLTTSLSGLYDLWGRGRRPTS